jgi:hypothetical protein
LTSLLEGHERGGDLVALEDRVRSRSGEVTAEGARIVRRKIEGHGAGVSLTDAGREPVA